MLVLRRRKNERVFIGDNVVVTVVEVRGNTVKLAFEAPAEISIQREEVHQRLTCHSDQEGITAATPACSAVS